VTVAHGGAMADRWWLADLEPIARYDTLNYTWLVPMGSQRNGDSI
jgi:hypothetical protein